MKNLLESQNSADTELREKSQKVCELLEHFVVICSTNEISSIDRDIERILYKINIMRVFAQILLTEHAASADLDFKDTLELLEILRHVSESRSIKYFQDKVEKRQDTIQNDIS